MKPTFNPTLAALLAVACWSTSATAIGLAAGSHAPMLLAAAVQLTGALVLLLFRRAHILSAFAPPAAPADGRVALVRPAPRRHQLLLFALLLLSYHLLFYTAIMSPVRLQANIANYLWPLLLVLTNYFVFRNTRSAPTVMDFCVLGLGFAGCLTLFGDPAVGLLQLPDRRGFVFGLGAALAAALYMGYSHRLVRTTRFTATQLWFFGLLIAAPVSLSIALLVGERLPASPAPFLMAAAWLGVVAVAVAQVSWTYSISHSASVLPAILAYLTPILSSLLQILVFGDHVTPNFIFGLTFVVFASIVTTKAFNSFFSELGAAIVFLYTAFVLNLKDVIGLDVTKNFAGDVPLEIFGIIAGFFWNRQWQRARESEISLNAWGAQLHRLCSLVQQPGGPVDEAMKRHVRELLQAVVELDQAQEKTAFLRCHGKFHGIYGGFESFMQRHADAPAAAACRSEMQGLLRGMQAEISRWIALKGDRTTTGDLLVIAVIGFGVVVMTIKTALLSQGLSLPNLLLPAAATYIGLRIAEYNSIPSMNSIPSIIQAQRVAELLRLPYFLGDYRQVQIDRSVRLLEAWITFTDEARVPHTVHASDPHSRLMRLVRARHAAVVFLIGVPLLIAALLWTGQLG